MQIRVDEAGLREELLRGGLVVGLRGRREVRIDLDPPAILVPATRMHGQPLELEEDLHVMLVSFARRSFPRWICGAL